MKAAFVVAVLVTSISLAYAASTPPEGVAVAPAAQGEARLTRLAGDAKMLDAPTILQALRDGAETTAIIVTLKPTPKAKYLAEVSRPAMRRPLEVDDPNAPVFYDLADLGIRSALHATVTDAVAQTVAALDIPGVTVTQKFSYQFGFAATVTAEALEAILAHPDVLQVEKDHPMQLALRQGIPVMNATVARSTYTGRGVAIAIVDSGIDTSHPKLGHSQTIFNSKVIGGRDVWDNDDDPRPGRFEEDGYHGTAVAGIAAGDLGDEGDYIGGVAPDAKLYAIKISNKRTGDLSDSAGIAGWEWAIKHQNDNPAYPILIMNNSWGGLAFGSSCDGQMRSMAQTASNVTAAGITLFAASGNQGLCASMNAPACLSTVISVGATYDANIGRSKDWCIVGDSCATNKQPTWGCPTRWAASDASTWAKKVTVYSNSASILTLFAPSHNAYTTTIGGSYMPDFGGTSAASPYAAGAAAVLQEAAKSKLGRWLTPAEVRQYLTTTGEMITDDKVAVTKPLINLTAAVAAIPGGSQPKLSVHLQGSGSGSVASAPAGIDCTGANKSCVADFGQGTAVTLTATPGVESAFVTWIGAGCATSPTCTVAMAQDQQVWATFAKSSGTYALTVYPQGTGTGKIISVPAGIDCGATCVAYYPGGAAVTLAARADPGSAFHGWVGAGCSGTGSCTVTLSQARQVWASFAKVQ